MRLLWQQGTSVAEVEVAVCGSITWMSFFLCAAFSLSKTCGSGAQHIGGRAQTLHVHYHSCMGANDMQGV